MSRHCGKRFYAAQGKLMQWVSCIRPGDWFSDDNKNQFVVLANNVEEQTIHVRMASASAVINAQTDIYAPLDSLWKHEDFAKMSLNLGLVRICNNCKRPRGEHLKRKKCLFGAGEWS